MIFCSAM